MQRLLNLVWDTAVHIEVQDYVDGMVDDEDELDASFDEADENGASQKPQDGRSEVPTDDIGDIPAGLDRRRQQ